jgi:hypothetical protein
MDDDKKVSDLKKAEWNPRRISEFDFKNLVQSMQTFGDLSGIVKNIETGNLVGGHQRLEAFKRLGAENIHIVQHMSDGPTPVGTLAYGYVINADGEQFAYREVMWDEQKEKAANIAANRIQGEFDLDQLAQINYELRETNPDLLALTGQTDEELDQLYKMVAGEPDVNLPDGEKPGFQQLTFTLTDEQVLLVSEALAYMKKHKSFDGSQNENSNGNALAEVAREFLDYTNDAQAA